MTPPKVLFSRPLIASVLAVYSIICVLHYSQLPFWMWLVSPVIIVWRIQILREKISPPNKFVKSFFVLFLSGILFLQYNQWLAIEPMVVFLIVALTLKLLEIRHRRDILVIVSLYYFVIACGFLFNQSVIYSLSSLLTIVFTTAILVQLHTTTLSVKKGLGLSAKLLLQSSVLAIVMVLVLPRLNPLWSVPLHSEKAFTGMSDTMSPGDIGDLIRSNALAFRVTFENTPPPQYALYWRGLVLDDFDGRRWQRVESVSQTISQRMQSSSVISQKKHQVSNDLSLSRYEILMEATGQQWLYGIPIAIVNKGVDALFYTKQGEIFQTQKVNQRIKYTVQSQLNELSDVSGLSDVEYRRFTRLPNGRNAQTQKTALQWRQQAGSEQAYIEYVLNYYRKNFTYSLSPPKLGKETVDEFLFDTKQGFCEHFSSSFTVLMRAVGIPARVVVGYQGGEWDDSNAYLQVYQRDAHAWSEVWLKDQGWVRIDPTAAAATIRIEQGVSAALPQSERILIGRSQLDRYRWLQKLQGQWQILDYRWQRWVLDYDTEKQQNILTKYLGDITITKMIMVVVIPLILVALMIGIGLFRSSFIRQSPERKLYRELQKKLERVGVQTRKGEPVRQYCNRAVEQCPHLKQPLEQIANRFEKWLYKPSTKADLLVEYKHIRSAIKEIKTN